MGRCVALSIALQLCACRQVFGLDEPSRSRDAAVDDSGDPDMLIDDAPTDSPASRSLQEMIVELGITSGLLVVLDAGDQDSYAGGPTWLNTVAGGPSFHRGADAAAGVDDPTFAGTAGARTSNEYFTFDGEDWFEASGTGWGAE